MKITYFHNPFINIHFVHIECFTLKSIALHKMDSQQEFTMTKFRETLHP